MSRAKIFCGLTEEKFNARRGIYGGPPELPDIGDVRPTLGPDEVPYHLRKFVARAIADYHAERQAAEAALRAQALGTAAMAAVSEEVALICQPSVLQIEGSVAGAS